MYNTTDPFILLSIINMKLRDTYSSLDQFCEEENIPKDALFASLAAIGYKYDENTNQFI